jgi:hypothetical protein
LKSSRPRKACLGMTLITLGWCDLRSAIR